MDEPQLPSESSAHSPGPSSSASRVWQSSSSSQSPDQILEEHKPEALPGQTEPTELEEQSVQGKALRSLVSNLISEKDLVEVNRHQASTLSQLVQIRQGLAAINKQSLDAYNDSAADFIKAARLAGQIKQNLNDISRRLAILKKTLGSRQAQQTAAERTEGS